MMPSHRVFAAALLSVAAVTASPAPAADTTYPAAAFAGAWARNSFNFEPIPGQPAPLKSAAARSRRARCLSLRSIMLSWWVPTK